MKKFDLVDFHFELIEVLFPVEVKLSSKNPSVNSSEIKSEILSEIYLIGQISEESL